MARLDRRQIFIDAVRTRLDASMADAGFPFNGVYENHSDPPDRNVSILYEGVVSDFLERYPALDPVWDEEWRRNRDGCVDLWIEWSEADDALASHLEHWEIIELAGRYGDKSLIGKVESALSGPGAIDRRVEVLVEVIRKALASASHGQRPSPPEPA